jgi:hypothetical protein
MGGLVGFPGLGLLRSVAAGCLLALLTSSAGLAAEQPVLPLPTEASDLAPGRYSSSAVGPAITLTLGEGWRTGATLGGPLVVLERADTPGAVLTITRFEGDTYTDSCDPSSLTRVDPSAERLVAIIAGDPSLRAVPARPARLGSFEGLGLDVAVPIEVACDLPFLLLWALDMEDGEFVQVPGQQSRFIVADVGGDVLVAAIEAFPGVPYGSFLEASLELVGSMHIEPGGSVPPADPSPAPGEPAGASASPASHRP